MGIEREREVLYSSHPPHQNLTSSPRYPHTPHQRFAMLYVLRWATVALTQLPNPNPACNATDRTNSISTWSEAAKRIVKRWPPVACGDLIFSGHAGNLTVMTIMGFKMKLWVHPVGYALSIGVFLLGSYSIVSCRSHYTIDLVLGWMIGAMATELLWVFSPVVPWICWLEMMPRKKIVYADPDEDVGMPNPAGAEPKPPQSRSPSMRVGWRDDADEGLSLTPVDDRSEPL